MTQPIIITGGTQRLGLAIADYLLQQGHPVVVTYRTFKPSVTALREAGAELIEVDFEKAAQVSQFIEHIQDQYTSIRAIIHNASDWQSESPSVDAAMLIRRMMQIHAEVPYQLNLAFKSLLLNSNETADIIHMTDYVQDKGSKKHIAYAASKAALHNLTLSFAALYAPVVKVNSIAPSLLMFNQQDTHQYRQKTLKKSLLEVCPGPKEAVEAVKYLLDSQYITGRTLHLDGGRHLKQ